MLAAVSLWDIIDLVSIAAPSIPVGVIARGAVGFVPLSDHG